MKLAIDIELNTGGRVRLNGEDLSVEDVNEVFRLCAGATVTNRWVNREEAIDDENVRTMTKQSPISEWTADDEA